MFFQNNPLKRAVLVCLVTCPFTLIFAQSKLDETVTTIEQWVDTERRISKEQSEWAADKAAMENLIEIYQQEIELLAEQIKEAESDTSVADEKRTKYLQRQTEIKEIEDKVVLAIAASEVKLKALQKFLPKPLQEELNPLFNSLPDDPKTSSVAIGTRIQPVIAILTQIQKFDQVVTVIEGYQEFEAGRTVQTETVYFGLGAAYYVDQGNQHAGKAVLTDSGWKWEIVDNLVPQVRQFIEIYRGTKQAAYVNLPVEVN